MTTMETFGPRKTHPKPEKGDIVACLAILSLPFILFAVNDNWIFSKPNGIDNWLYPGFHLHLPKLLKDFGYTYYASRVPWTVTGWLVHSAFDDEHALYLLHFGVFYLAVFSLYAVVRTVFANSAAAGAAAFLLGTNSYFLTAAGWGYVDGSSIGCLLAALAALASAAIRPRWRLAAFMWGVAATMIVSNYILLVVFVPVQIGLFLFLNRVRGKHPVLAVAVWFAIGGVAAMLFLGLINWLLGGPFLYLEGQIRILVAVSAKRFLYDAPLSQWLWSAPWLWVPIVTFAFSCAYVSLHSRPVSKKMRLGNLGADPEVSIFICCLANIAAALIFIGLQADHFYVLQMSYNADALLPFTYLTIGAALSAVIKPSSLIRQIGVLATVVAITLVPWALATVGYIFPLWDLSNRPPLEIAGIAVGALLLLFVVQRSNRIAGAVLMILFFSVANLTSPSRRLSYPPDPALKSETLAIYDASRAIGPYYADVRDKRTRFWYDGDDPNAFPFVAIASTYLYGYSLVNEDFPKLVAADGQQSSIVAGDRIILLTSKGDEDPIALANAAVADRRLSFAQVAKIEIRRPGIAFTAYVTDVKKDTSKY
jgi:hypothetical protein